MATKGYAAPEVEQAYARALALCQSMSEAPRLFPTLYGLWAFHLTRGEHHTAHPLAERMLRLAERTRDGEYLIQAHQALGLGHYFRGEFATARRHLREAMPADDWTHLRSSMLVYGHDPRVVSLVHTAWTLWMLGYPDQARQRSSEALVMARQIAYAPTVASALYAVSVIDNWLGEWSSALSW